MTAQLHGVDVDSRLAVVVEVVEQHVRSTDRDATFPVAALDALRRTGLLGLLVSPEYGGLGGTVRDMAACAQRLGRSDMSVAMVFAMHCQQVQAVSRFAGAELSASLLPRLAAGDVYLASVTTEAGGDLFGVRAPLVATEDHVRIERFAPIVTGAAHADGFLITMRGLDATTVDDVALVYADRDQLAVECSGDWQPMGMRASHSIPVRLRGSVPRHQVIGGSGVFHRIATEVFAPLAHIGWSAAWLGTAAGALSRVLHLVRDPKQRNSFDIGSELLLTRLSRSRQQLDTVHALLRQAVDLVESGADLQTPPRQLLLNSLKISASELCLAAVDGLVDAVGLRHGYLRDSPTRLEQALRDLRSAALNYSNDRLHLADGRLALRDRGVHFVD
ncbi:acyl-CoA dehydrogenase family protein [Nocardia iowensis]|uniref:Acyl-CoA/acyl-ACP dehydrogenase n=1 Tax=Nocardia iowensis TaxID=204891 RepID=A0ABX8RMG2_NOCIO|nr:acyl-CoA dehydrogenase family protein [Nocardia iowensis]QXN88606.1 acyl-CoA/acyl-ACP dehydrogenase [Nocardia iowensis]